MKFLPALFLSVLTAVAADGPKQSIEKLNPALDALLDSSAKIETISNGGYSWSEGPVWYKGRIVFSDVPKNIAYQWIEGDAMASIFLKPSGTDAPALAMARARRTRRSPVLRSVGSCRVRLAWVLARPHLPV